MMKLKVTALCVSAAILLTLGSGFASAESVNEPTNYTIDTPYNYPVRPGMPEWAEFTNHQQMINACEIPETILHSMTTEALVDTVLNYPLWIDPYLHDDINYGFSLMANHFNGMTELMTREEASDLLLERYQQTEILNPVMLHSIDVEDYFYLSNIELMLAQEVFYSSLDEESQTILTVEAEEKYEQRSKYPEKYGTITQSTFYYALGQQQEIELLAGEVFETTTVLTPRGSAVTVQRRHDFNEYSAAMELQASKDAYPLAVDRGGATWRYNCHSYAWYNPSTSNPYWMNDPSKYWTDGSYVTAFASAGRIVTYRSYNTLDHSGIVMAASGSIAQTVRSKWGFSGLFDHAPTYCPYYYGGSAYGGTSLTYYTRQ